MTLLCRLLPITLQFPIVIIGVFFNKEHTKTQNSDLLVLFIDHPYRLKKRRS